MISSKQFDQFAALIVSILINFLIYDFFIVYFYEYFRFLKILKNSLYF